MANTAATPIPKNQARFTLSEIASATCARIAPDVETRLAQIEVVGVCTDSRAVEPGNLYVALRGETHDGHRFVKQAIERGALAVLVSDDAGIDAGAPVIRVQDTMTALGDLAALHRARWGGRVIAITGSAGKTTTKELAYAALRACGCRVARTEGNLNNLIGVPMTLLCLGAEVEMIVLEVGTSARGEIARLAEIARPDVGVVTSVAVAHSAGLGSLADIAAEKASLLWSIAKAGSVVCFADEPVLLARLAHVRAKRTLLFGAGENAAVRLTGHAIAALPDGSFGMRCELAIDGSAPMSVSMQLLGPGPALDLAAVLAVVLAERGADALPAAAKGLAEVQPVAGRLSPRKGPRGSIILDDSYNANSASMAVSIEAACELAVARGGRALLALGDMLELGELSAAEHAAVGRAAARGEVSLLITSGPEMSAAVAAAREHAQRLGLPLKIEALDDPQAVAALLLAQLTPDDVVLVKGSRGMRMERVVDALLSHADPAGGRA